MLNASRQPKTSISSRIVILGAGQAGLSAAAVLRSGGHEGKILLIGAEPVAPYHRPPLSKAFLKGETDIEGLRLRSHSFHVDHKVCFRPGATVGRIDRNFAVLHLKNGRLIYIETINNAADFTAGKRLIALREPLDVDTACDATIPLKHLIPLANDRTAR